MVLGNEQHGRPDEVPGQELMRLREQDAFKTRFLNMVAHELNTPLTPLRIQMHMLRSTDSELPEKHRRAVEVASRNVDRIEALVKEILDVTRMESGGLRFKVENFALALAVEDAVENFESTAKAIDIQLTASVPDSLALKTDRNRFEQILLNLISNGLKFTPAGGKVTVSARATAENVVVEVQDTGIGLSADQINLLFRPFSQVHDTMQVSAAGSGLGLYVSRGLAEAMGGTLTVTSPGLGHGTTFRLTMPRTFEALPTAKVPLKMLSRQTPEEVARRIRELI